MTERAQGEPRFPLLARAYAPLVALLLTALLTALVRRPLRAFDTYFHLRFGEEFRRDWSIAHPGQLSSASTNDWVPTQWLSQVALARIDDSSGTTGLVLAFAAVVVAFVAATYLLLRRHAGPGIAITLTVVVVLGCLPSLSLRPQLLSYLFLVAVLAAWDGARTTGRPPWALIPLGWLWATCHGMWLIGVAACGLLAVLVVVERRPRRTGALALLAVPAGMLLAALVTPVGPRLLTAVLLVNSRADYFAEWAAPELITVAAAPVTVLAAAAVLLLVRRTDVRPYDLGLLAMGGAFALYSDRTVPLALVTLAAVVAPGLSRWSAHRPVARTELAVALGLAAVVIAVAPNQGLVDDSADRVRPFTARLDALPAGTRVLTDWPVGGVLLRLDPGLDIPLHGYGDVYTDAELERYADLDHLEPGWDRTLAALAPGAALLPNDAPLAYALERDGWSVEQRTEELVLLAPPAS
ncbi:hypothetical protein ACFFOS_06335 [Nocardioides kongjuensis]|uniref:Glycosyltransferase RgtA/B/C/D-like domain-containing protein n=1 Tax=Nocardioides kongjuensis TaxID=349522 RepID=A0A852RUR0_9ACTN|nr:hypothetical protein [Nocardioides kongjuensis]NYD30302.1 hypothetical protein [Nocardioides kongjuensis]